MNDEINKMEKNRYIMDKKSQASIKFTAWSLLHDSMINQLMALGPKQLFLPLASFTLKLTPSGLFNSQYISYMTAASSAAVDSFT
jgi:hypothetical protein